METKFDLLLNRFGGRVDAASHDGLAAFDEVAAVISEVIFLLNTRSPFPAPTVIGARRRTVLEYGLADFSHYSPSSRQDAQLLENLIHTTVLAFEPRLFIDNVKVECPRPRRDGLSALISGHVRKRDFSTVAVTFPVSVGVLA